MVIFHIPPVSTSPIEAIPSSPRSPVAIPRVDLNHIKAGSHPTPLPPPSPQPPSPIHMSPAPVQVFHSNSPPKSLKTTTEEVVPSEEVKPPYPIVPVTAPLEEPPVNPYEATPVGTLPDTEIVRPVSRGKVTVPPLMSYKPLNLDDDESDEEEVLFTKTMITRLNNKLIAEGEEPVPVSEDRPRPKKNKLEDPPLPQERPASVTKRPDSGIISIAPVDPEPIDSAESELPNSGTTSSDIPINDKEKLSDSEMEKVLKEIEAYDNGTDGSNGDGGGYDGNNIVTDKKYYFRSRLAELHNLGRLLEQKKDEALDREEYSKAGGIDKALQQLKLREEPLKELLIERMDAIHKGDYEEAQNQKDRFELNLEAAMDIPELTKYVTPAEMSKIRKDAKGVKPTDE